MLKEAVCPNCDGLGAVAQYPLAGYQAVEAKWPFEPNEQYPELNTAVVEITGGNKNVIATTGNWVDARLIAASLNYVLFAPSVKYHLGQKYGHAESIT